MEHVKAFNTELTALYDGKPPISRAKMALLTKSAIKAIKFYKHVVQSVEKFIQKCHPEYKIPGLYVIDSIVRSSRHQYGGEKDVFAPRFSKNIVQTFQNLLKCDPDDKPKLIRVLNLWQKNTVYGPAVIQPLLDMAADPENQQVFQQALKQVQEATGLQPALLAPKPSKSSSKEKSSTLIPAATEEKSTSNGGESSSVGQEDDLLKAVSQLLQSTPEPSASSQPLSLSAQEAQLQQLQLLQEQLVQQSKLLQVKPAVPQIDSSLLTQIQKLTSQLLGESSKEEIAPAATKTQETFDKNLLDFDYGESDEDDGGGTKPSPQPQKSNITGKVENILRDEGIMQQIQQVSESIQKTEELKHELDTHRHRMMRDEDVSSPPRHRRQKEEEMDTASPSRHQRQEKDVESHRHRRMEEEEDLDSHRHRRMHEEEAEKEGHRHRSTSRRVQEEDPDRHRQRRLQEDEIDSHRHRRMQEEYEEMGHRDRDSSFEEPRRPREPPHPPEPAGYPEDSFDGQHSQDASRDYSHDDFNEREDGEYEEGEYVEDEYTNDSYINHHEIRDTRVVERMDRNDDRQRIMEREEERHRRSDSNSMDTYSGRRSLSARRDREIRELPFGPSREYYERPSRKHRRLDRSRSRSRSPKRKKRSKSRDRRSRSREKVKSTKSKEHKKRSKSKDRDKERRRREKEREKGRRARGLPPLKENYLTVCSKTLWIGHLNKQTTDEILRKELQQYGPVVKISLVLPRGCAFVSLSRRKDAADALKNIRGTKLLGNSLKADWAPGKGIRDSREFNKKFDTDLGAVYISYDKLHYVDLDEVAEGGMVDEESLPYHMKTVIDLEESIVIDDGEDEVQVVEDRAARKKRRKEEKRQLKEAAKAKAATASASHSKPSSRRSTEAAASTVLPREPKPAPPPPEAEPAPAPPLPEPVVAPEPVAIPPPVPAVSVVSQGTIEFQADATSSNQQLNGMVPRAVVRNLSSSGSSVPQLSRNQKQSSVAEKEGHNGTVGDEDSTHVMDMSMSPVQETSPAKLHTESPSEISSGKSEHNNEVKSKFDLPAISGDYDPSQPSENSQDNQIADNEFSKPFVLPILLPMKLGTDSDDEGFLPLVRSRSSKKITIKKQTKLDVPSTFEANAVMGRKKSISIVIDKKKNVKDDAITDDSKNHLQKAVINEKDISDESEEKSYNMVSRVSSIVDTEDTNKGDTVESTSATTIVIDSDLSIIEPPRASQTKANDSSLFDVDISSISVPPVSSINNSTDPTTSNYGIPPLSSVASNYSASDFLQTISLPQSGIPDATGNTISGFPTMIPPPFPTNLFPLQFTPSVGGPPPSHIPPPGQIPPISIVSMGQMPASSQILSQSQNFNVVESSPSKVLPPSSVPNTFQSSVPPMIPPPSMIPLPSINPPLTTTTPFSGMNWIPPPPQAPSNFGSNFSLAPSSQPSNVLSSTIQTGIITGNPGDYMPTYGDFDSLNKSQTFDGSVNNDGMGNHDVDLRKESNNAPFPGPFDSVRPNRNDKQTRRTRFSSPEPVDPKYDNDPNSTNEGSMFMGGQSFGGPLSRGPPPLNSVGEGRNIDSGQRDGSQHFNLANRDRPDTSGMNPGFSPMSAPRNPGPNYMDSPINQEPFDEYPGESPSQRSGMRGSNSMHDEGNMGGPRSQGTWSMNNPSSPFRMGGLMNEGMKAGQRDQGSREDYSEPINSQLGDTLGGIRNRFPGDSMHPEINNLGDGTRNQGPMNPNPGLMGGGSRFQGSGFMDGPRNQGPRLICPRPINQAPVPFGGPRKEGPMGGMPNPRGPINPSRMGSDVINRGPPIMDSGPMHQNHGPMGGEESNQSPFPMDSGPMNKGPGQLSEGPLNQGPIFRGPGNQGPMGGPMNRGPSPMGGGPMNRGPSPMGGGPMVRGPGPMGGGPMHRGPVPMGGMANQGPRQMDGGPINQGPIGGPGNQGPRMMDSGPINQGPGPMGGPIMQGSRMMDSGPINQGLGPMGGPRMQGPRMMESGPMNQGPGPMGGPRMQGPRMMEGGSMNQGPGPMSGPRIVGPGMMDSGPMSMNQGPRPMGGGPTNQPRPMGGPINQSPGPMGGPRNQGPPIMDGGPMNRGPRPMGGPRNPGPPMMNSGPMNQGPGQMDGGPINQGFNLMGKQGPGPMDSGPMNQGPCQMNEDIESRRPGPSGGGSMNQGPRPMGGGPRNMGPGPMGQGPGSMGNAPRHQRPGYMGSGPGNQGPSGGPRNPGPGSMGDDTGFQGSGPIGEMQRNQGPGPMNPMGVPFMGGPRGPRPLGGPMNRGPPPNPMMRCSGPGDGPKNWGPGPGNMSMNQGPPGPRNNRPGPMNRGSFGDSINPGQRDNQGPFDGSGDQVHGDFRSSGPNEMQNSPQRFEPRDFGRQQGVSTPQNQRPSFGGMGPSSGPRPKIPSLLDSDMRSLGPRGPPIPGPGFKNKVQGLMSIGPSLTELGVDMDAVKRQNSNRSNDSLSETYSNTDRDDYHDESHERDYFHGTDKSINESFQEREQNRERDNFRGRGRGFGNRSLRNRNQDSFSDQPFDNYERRGGNRHNSPRRPEKRRSSREMKPQDYDIDNWGDDNWSRDNWGEDDKPADDYNREHRSNKKINKSSEHLSKAKQDNSKEKLKDQSAPPTPKKDNKGKNNEDSSNNSAKDGNKVKDSSENVSGKEKKVDNVAESSISTSNPSKTLSCKDKSQDKSQSEVGKSETDTNKGEVNSEKE